MTARAIDFLPAYFSRDPLAVEAIHFSTPDRVEFSWRIHDFTLELRSEGRDLDLSLTGIVVGDVVDALQAAGYAVQGWEPDVMALGAEALLPSSGVAQGDTSGTLAVHTSILFSLLGGPERERAAFEAELPNAIEQITLTTAAGYWLDVHGQVYGIPRPEGMPDAEYVQHILDEVRRARDNPAAMESNLRRLLGIDIRVYEPWKMIARWSRSKPSTGPVFESDPFYIKNIIQLRAPNRPRSWVPAMGIAEADRPAGTLLFEPQWDPWARHILVNPGVRSFNPVRVWSSHIRGLWHLRHDYSRASVDKPALNRNFVSISAISGRVDGGVGDPLGINIGVRRFCFSDAVWSVGPELGSIDCRFPGLDRLLITGDQKRFSDDLVLSDYIVERTWIPICKLTGGEKPMFASVNPIGPVASSMAQVHTMSARVASQLWRGWAWGGWDDHAWSEGNIGSAYTLVEA